MGQFYKAAKATDVASGKLRYVEIKGRHIALFSIGQEIYALGDLHTHAFSTPPADRLTDALPAGNRLTELDPAETTPPNPPAASDQHADIHKVETIERYNVRIQDGDIEIEII